jgi:hypothetical protein
MAAATCSEAAIQRKPDAAECGATFRFRGVSRHEGNASAR